MDGSTSGEGAQPLIIDDEPVTPGASGEAKPSDVTVEVGPTMRRWAVLFAFCSLSMTNSLMWISFAPVRAGTASYYGVAGDTVDWLSMIFMAIYPFVFAPMSWYIENGGFALQMGLRTSAFLNVVAGVVRWYSAYNHSFYMLFAGQTIGAIAQGFTLGAPPRISGLWFAEDEWGLSTGIGVLSNQVGPAVAYFVAPLMVNATTGAGMKAYLLLEIGSFVFTFVFVCVAIPTAPSRPPSLVAANRKEEEQRSLWDYCTSVVDMCCQLNLFLLSMGYALLVGVLYAFETLIGPLLPTLTEKQVSAIGIAALVSGLPGAVFGGWVMDVTGAYKMASIFFCVLSAATLAAVAAVASTAFGHFELLMVLTSAMGFLLCAGLSAGFEWGVELSFPIPESTVAGVLNVFAQLGGIGLIYGIEGVVAASGPTTANAVLAAAMLGAGMFYAAIADELKRQSSKTRLNELAAEFAGAPGESTPLQGGGGDGG